MHDIADLESRGIPGGFIASTEFIQAADVQAEALGVEKTVVYVPHPIQDRTDAEMIALADDAIASIVGMILETR